MNLGFLYLESILTGIITSDEMNWVTSNQPHFSRVEEATALKLGRLLDRGLIQIVVVLAAIKISFDLSCMH